MDTVLNSGSVYSHCACKSKTEVTDAKGYESIDIHDVLNMDYYKSVIGASDYPTIGLV
jgi:hypothetical protein